MPEEHSAQVIRYHVDRKMSPDSVRLLRASLKSHQAEFFDKLDEWESEEEVVIHKRDFRAALRCDGDVLSWSDLEENRVFLWGAFALQYKDGEPAGFEVIDTGDEEPGDARWMRIDDIPFVRAEHERQYAECLTGGPVLYRGEGAKDDELIVHVLNVGRGDTIIIEFPADGNGLRRYGVVDCVNYDKFESYMKQLHKARPGDPRLLFVCATHPHRDHIEGMSRLLKNEDFTPEEFWDSGFRMASGLYRNILLALRERQIPMVRVSSGMERYVGPVRITALAPSIQLRNTYGTYGVDVNNASVVLRLENHKRGDAMLGESDRYCYKYEYVLDDDGNRVLDDKGKPKRKKLPNEDPVLARDSSKGVIILGGDAEFDSWARIHEEFPYKKAEKRTRHDPLLVRKVLNMLKCQVIKVSHHGSMHSIPLEIFERMAPRYAIISTEQERQRGEQGWLRTLFPHPTTIDALREVGAKIYATDNRYEDGEDGDLKVTPEPGSVVIALPPKGSARIKKMTDGNSDEVPSVEELSSI